MQLGMANGLETLCGQAYGAQQYHMLGNYLQRPWLVLIIASTVIVPFFILTAPNLKALGQEAEIADMAQSMATWMVPVVYSFVLAYTCQMYLQAKSKNMIIAYLAAVSLALHVFLSWLLTMKFEFGVTGAMVSTVVAFWLPNLSQLAFVACGDETWQLLSLNINGWELMISLGFMAAASVRISNELGAGNSKAAKFSIATIVITSLSIGLVLFVVFLVFRRRVAYLFTDSEEVAAVVDHMGPLLAFSILLNSVQPALSGEHPSIYLHLTALNVIKYISVCCNKIRMQGTVAWVNLTTYYIIGLPVGIVLLYFLDWGVEGIWIRTMIVVLIQSLVLVWITYGINWEKQVEIAHGRVNRWLVKDEQN
ncbi:hypothetical protein SASPL_132464 [Salvia splendens]|uniref:Multidrug resistance protein, MATE family n=1 Tax=Salvia splendens TaxID=180675 RepID=A0A8X8X207_SALSN|nr:hypothetical protein SASPL_132464 [Salvia splendens]